MHEGGEYSLLRTINAKQKEPLWALLLLIAIMMADVMFLRIMFVYLSPF